MSDIWFNENAQYEQNPTTNAVCEKFGLWLKGRRKCSL